MSDTAVPAEQATIRVMLVDDQTLVRQGVRSLLELADDIVGVGQLQ